MATYLCVKEKNNVKLYKGKSTASNPYLKINTAFFPLTSEITGETGIRIKGMGDLCTSTIETSASQTVNTNSTETYSYQTTTSSQYDTSSTNTCTYETTRESSYDTSSTNTYMYRTSRESEYRTHYTEPEVTKTESVFTYSTASIRFTHYNENYGEYGEGIAATCGDKMSIIKYSDGRKVETSVGICNNSYQTDVYFVASFPYMYTIKNNLYGQTQSDHIFMFNMIYDDVASNYKSCTGLDISVTTAGVMQPDVLENITLSASINYGVNASVAEYTSEKTVYYNTTRESYYDTNDKTSTSYYETTRESNYITDGESTSYYTSSRESDYITNDKTSTFYYTTTAIFTGTSVTSYYTGYYEILETTYYTTTQTTTSQETYTSQSVDTSSTNTYTYETTRESWYEDSSTYTDWYETTRESEYITTKESQYNSYSVVDNANMTISAQYAYAIDEYMVTASTWLSAFVDHACKEIDVDDNGLYVAGFNTSSISSMESFELDTEYTSETYVRTIGGNATISGNVGGTLNPVYTGRLDYISSTYNTVYLLNTTYSFSHNFEDIDVYYKSTKESRYQTTKESQYQTNDKTFTSYWETSSQSDYITNDKTSTSNYTTTIETTTSQEVTTTAQTTIFN